MACINLSETFRQLGDRASAAQASWEGLEHARACGDAEAEGKIEYNVALLHEEEHEFELALERYGRSLALAAHFNDVAGAAQTHARMRFAHSVLARRHAGIPPLAEEHAARARTHGERAAGLAGLVCDEVLDSLVVDAREQLRPAGGPHAAADAEIADAERAVALYERLGMADHRAEALDGLATLRLRAAGEDGEDGGPGGAGRACGWARGEARAAALCEAALRAAREAARAH